MKKKTYEMVGGEPVSDICPECDSPDAFYHCWPNCIYPTIVTCIKCKCPYKTNKRLPKDDLLKKSW